jgi:imidazolonepropionase-like amidohydrolase
MRALTALVLALIAAPLLAAGDVYIHADWVHTMAGPRIENGAILIRNGKIESIGPASSIAPPAGIRMLRAKVATPGLVDAHSVVGLAGYLDQDHDQDQLDRSNAMHPELRAIDGYNPREPLVEWVRNHGVTTIHTGHGPGALISGQTMIAKTRGMNVDAAVMVPFAMVAATLGEGALAEQGKSPGTRSKGVAMLRQELIKAAEYRRKKTSAADDKKPAQDVHLDALVSVLEKKTPLLVTAHRERDIMTALRLAKEFDISVVLDGAAESYLALDAIKAARVPVLLHPTMARSVGEAENLSKETSSTLRSAGIPFAIQSGFESYVPKSRVLLFEAALAASHGLSFDDALAAVTIEPAKILGIAARVGSLARGKDGDVALYDGDPFEFTSHVTHVVIDGEVVSERPH